MTIYGDGEQIRSFSYIDDSLESLWNASQLQAASKEIINVGSTKHFTINEANAILSSVIGDGKVIYKEQRHEVKSVIPSYEKSINILGYEDKTSLENGLKSMWEWVKKQPNRDRWMWDKYELEKGIYSYWKK
jgi:nucleoside-diphosphate-sugar epimerase